MARITVEDCLKKILSKKFIFDSFVTDYKKVLQDQDIDVVLILTSMLEHSKIAKAALLYNKHVLVEKPMATNLKDLNEKSHINQTRRKHLEFRK